MIQHKELALGRWAQMSLCEQMANVGSEVSRALNWRNKNNAGQSARSVNRALELVELTIDSVKISSQQRELTRLRECMVDYFYGENQFLSSEDLWRKYFDHFNYAVRKDT